MFGRKDNMLRHMRTVHKPAEDLDSAGDQGPYKCYFCKEEFSKKFCLTRHLVGHSESKFTCKECGKQFSRLDSLRRHNSVHQKESSKFECKLCQTNFTAKTNLQHHEKAIYSSENLQTISVMFVMRNFAHLRY